MSLLHWSWIAYWVGALADWYTTKRGLTSISDPKREVGGFGLIAKLMQAVGRDWAVTVLKGGGFVFFLWYGMPLGVYFLAGGAQLLAAVGNHYGWWGPVIIWVRERWSRLKS